MSVGGEIGFDTDLIGAGGDAAAGTAVDAAAVIDRLSGLVIDPGVFGRVSRAGPLAAALTSARDGSRHLGERVRQVHDELSHRARQAADQGEQLVDTTTRVARLGAAQPGPVPPLPEPRDRP